MCGRCGLAGFADFLVVVLRAEIVTNFKAESGSNSARGTIVGKFANFVGLCFPHICNIFRPNFGILLLFRGSFRECGFFGRDLSRTKIGL